MSFEQWSPGQGDPGAFERFPKEMNDDLASAIAKGFAQLEEHLDAIESRLIAHLADLDVRLTQDNG